MNSAKDSILEFKSEMKKIGFPPIIGGSPKLLILGSMPGEASLNKQQYYAHPRNSFWDIMGHLFNFNKGAGYEEKVSCLIDNNIALWDVIEKCRREGSLDSSIVTDSITVNNFESLFSEYVSIRHVFFNGLKAEKEFKKRVLPNLNGISRDILYQVLPSTSPANAMLNKEEKLKKWSKIKSI